VPVVTFTVTVPASVPDAELSDNQVVLVLALQFKVPPPVLLMLNVCAVGLLPPCCAVKDKLAGLAPIAGLTGTTGAEGGLSSCANPGISAANLLIDRPPVLPLPDDEELPALAAATGTVPADVVPTAMEPVAVAVARGAAASALLLRDEGSLG